MLTDTLIQFPDTIVLISHDPTFLMRVSTNVVEIDEGQARDYIGAYEYYCWKCAKELEDQIPPEAKLDKKKEKAQKEQPTTEHVTNGKAPTAVVPPAGPSRRDLSKSIARLEKQVATAEQEIATLEEQFKARDIERPPQKPTKIIHAGMLFIKNERNGLATWTASPTNGATSPPNSKNNNPKFLNIKILWEKYPSTNKAVIVILPNLLTVFG